ncbi:Shedu anti-phage system protein SduA domain-containing protein [Priestia megaterium]|uniref:Shedu anti-phage system protein SduA domain-containing protein n=1 Tax=Priestia megaterium TaxID=1404 RepID=UPI003D9950ED
MKSQLEVSILGNMVNGFYNQFLTEINNSKENFKKVGINIGRALPSPFNTNTPISCQVIYSVDRKHLMLNFSKDKDFKFSFYPVMGNVIPGGVISFEGEVETTLSGVTIKNGASELYLDYALCISETRFINYLRDIKKFTRDFISVNWGFYTSNKSRSEYIFQLERLRQEMSDLFFNESIDELVLDKFLEDNPIILEQGLNLFKPMHQAVLKNILGIYEHDLKPDLIAFDDSDKMWAIVDYKKAKRNIIKNHQKVRTGFKAEVHSLEDQLRDYREYFEEAEHRKYVKDKYRVEIKYPKAVGIIGNVEESKQVDFNRLVLDKPKWFSLVPYNYLYDNFCRHINMASSLIVK